LLWALESLAWNPETLPRVVLILARLAQVEINDNWINKPMHSLQSIFRAWMPQTSASLADRVGLMNKLAKRFPDVAWKICMSQFGNYHETGDYSHKPRWRPDGFGFGEPIRSLGPIMEFKREMVELALAWKDHKVETLVDLVERLHSLDEGYRLRVWELIEAWANAKATDAEKAAMREKIRLAVLSKRAARYAKKSADFAKVIVKAKATLKALEPTDLINKHAWLFRNNRVEESADENDENENIDEFDFQGREKRIEKLRIDAIRQIRDQCGLPALLELAQRGKAAWLIGFYTARDILSEASAVELLRLALNSIKNGTDGLALMEVIGGALRAISEANESTFENVLKAIGAGLPEEDMVLLLVLAPFGKCTWRLVDAQSKEAQAKYWSDDRLPGWIRDSDVEINEGVERLLSAGRPRAAFSCAQFYLDKFDAQVIFRLLTAVAVGGNEKSDEHMLEKYYIEQAFKQLDASSLLTVEQKAGLEFAFLDFLAWSSDHSADGYGIPNIERYIESNPRVFVQAITWAYKRKDGGTDPIEFQAPKDSLKNLAARRYKLLGSLQRIPGHDRRGELQANLLLNWVAAVRKDSDELGRADVADFCIGRLLANAPVGKDGVWPCETVREVMEEIQSESIMRGAHNGVYNSRGVHFRPEGGDPERELAAGYRNWGQSLQFSHPYVASHLLEMLARTYEQEAEREDLEAGIRRRLE
jgi:hypothetical protein